MISTLCVYRAVDPLSPPPTRAVFCPPLDLLHLQALEDMLINKPVPLETRAHSRSSKAEELMHERGCCALTVCVRELNAVP